MKLGFVNASAVIYMMTTICMVALGESALAKSLFLNKNSFEIRMTQTKLLDFGIEVRMFEVVYYEFYAWEVQKKIQDFN